MVVNVVVIPLFFVTIIGLISYLFWKFALQDWYNERSLYKLLRGHGIDKTPLQIIKEHHEIRGETLSYTQIQNIEKNYRKNEPQQFLVIEDAIKKHRREEKKREQAEIESKENEVDRKEGNAEDSSKEDSNKDND